MDRLLTFISTEVEKAEEAFLRAKPEIDAKKREADRFARKEKERIETEETQKLQALSAAHSRSEKSGNLSLNQSYAK